MIWKIRDKNIEYNNGKIVIMGIVNVTPDSFSDGGSWFSPSDAVAHALELINDGADIVDLGAQSTRPGYIEISPEEEWARLEPVLAELRAKTDCPISVDTYYPFVAKKVLEAGADIINDVSGVITEKMASVVAEYNAGWVIMHNGASDSKDMPAFFEKAVALCTGYGVKNEQICFDMGIGFGKDYEQNLDLIANIDSYKPAGYPMLLGTSRKRVIATSSNQADPIQRVYGNIAADTVAIFGGADIIRLHDVKNEKQGILTAQELFRARK